MLRKNERITVLSEEEQDRLAARVMKVPASERRKGKPVRRAKGNRG